MIKEVVKKYLSETSFIFFGAMLSGVVFIGVCSSFELLLSERGVSITKVTTVMLATLPYSWRFAMSPYIKHLIKKHAKNDKNIVKNIAYITQAVLLPGFAALGYFETRGSLWIAAGIIFMLAMAISAHDILRDHIKLSLFNKDELGPICAIENTGYRIGIFIAGACIIYIADKIGWFWAYIIVGTINVTVTITTYFMRKSTASPSEAEIEQTTMGMEYCHTVSKFFKSYGIFAFLLLIIAFKMADSCINMLQPMFLRSLDVSRVEFANIKHLYGLITATISGLVAGAMLTKIKAHTCIKLTLIMHMLASLAYMYLAAYKSTLLTITVLTNVAAFAFGFGNVVYRTILSRESQKDVNMYTILLSLGSLVRIFSIAIAGPVAEKYSWCAIYFICIISNVPGYFLCNRLRKQKNI